MIADALDPHRTVILVVPAVREVYGFNPAGLSITQKSAKRLADNYRNAFILDHDGLVRRFERIDVLGPAGTSALRRMISRVLTGTKRISVTLSEAATMPLDELKALLIACIENGGYFVQLELDQTELRRIATAIESATDTASLFQICRPGPLEDALDGL